jgi:hypothetical protein
MGHEAYYDYNKLEERGFGGEEAVQVKVTKDDGTYVCFWVKVRVNNHGNVSCEVACNTKTDSRRKNIIGVWHKPRKINPECNSSNNELDG